ncbi:MAG: OmpA family protein [Desulfuromonadaceae bacterium]|nr:OmpA family protein [Desulfuromonadaceae bacterium]
MNISRISYQLKAAAISVSVGAMLTGCSGAIDPSEQIARDRLEQARSAYAEAKANPMVEAHSMKTLLGAEKVLQEAEQVNKKAYAPNPNEASRGYDADDKKLFFDDVSRLSYMAERKSQTAVALAEGVGAQTEIVRLGKERAEVQLLKSQLEQKLLQQDLNEKAAALERARQQLAVASSEADRARILADIHAQEAAILKTQADAQYREAEKEKAELAQLLKELSELQGQLTDRGIVLTIGDVLFATGKSNLNVSAQSSMDKIAGFLQKKQNRNLLVEGHTDSVGNEQYNQELSEQRAASVKNALVSRGIAGERVVTIGYGEKYPLAGNDTAVGKQRNRRVEAIILNEGVTPESQFRK